MHSCVHYRTDGARSRIRSSLGPRVPMKDALFIRHPRKPIAGSGRMIEPLLRIFGGAALASLWILVFLELINWWAPYLWGII